MYRILILFVFLLSCGKKPNLKYITINCNSEWNLLIRQSFTEWINLLGEVKYPTTKVVCLNNRQYSIIDMCKSPYSVGCANNETGIILFNTGVERMNLSLITLIRHEIGHIFGASHSRDAKNVMYGYISPGIVLTITDDDVKNVLNFQKANFGLYKI